MIGCRLTVCVSACSHLSWHCVTSPLLPFVDVDECASGAHMCKSSAACQNTDGSYMCTCSMGMSLQADMSCAGKISYRSGDLLTLAKFPLMYYKIAEEHLKVKFILTEIIIIMSFYTIMICTIGSHSANQNTERVLS